MGSFIEAVILMLRLVSMIGTAWKSCTAAVDDWFQGHGSQGAKV